MGHHVSLAFAIALAGIAQHAVAQNVLVVAPTPGPGVFSTQIQPAVDAAANGDLILVKSGNYLGFAIDGKALVVVADLNASVNVMGNVSISNLTSSQRAHLAKITITSSGGAGSLFLNNDAGPVWIEDCVIAPIIGSIIYGLDAANVLQCASVAFLRCTMTGSNAMAWKGPSHAGTGLFASDSNVTLYDSVCVGGIGETGYIFVHPGNGEPGAYLNSGFVFASRTSFQGGMGGSSGSATPPVNGGNGGDGIYSNASVVALECSFHEGNGGFSSSGNEGAPGISENGAIDHISGTSRHFKITSPIREMHNTIVTCSGIPGESAAMIISLDQDVGKFLSDLGGVLLPSLTGADALFLGTIPVSGVLSQQLLAPSLPAAVMGHAIYCQSFFYDAPITSVFLGPGSALVLLDSTL